MNAEEFTRMEQASLWDDLTEQIRHAANGAWSIGAGNVAYRVAAAARIVGPTPPGEVPWALLSGGVYEAVLTVAGVPVPELSDAQWYEYERLMTTTQNGHRHGDNRAMNRERFRRTVAAINTPREIANIRGEA